MTLSREIKGRKAALAALVIGVGLFIGLVSLTLVFVYGSQREEREENLRQLATYRSEIDARPLVETAYTQLKSRIAAMPGLIHADSGAPAAAMVQTAVKEIADSVGGEVRSAQVLPSAVANGFEIVSIECDLTVPASRLKDLAYAIETHRPYLFIETADITAPISWDLKSTVEPTYEVRWNLRAYRWTGGRS
jgi:hypothetical protein